MDVCERFLSNPALTLQLRLDVHDVVAGLRPSARVMIRDVGEAACVAAYVSTHGGDIAVSRGVLYHRRTQANWSDEVENTGAERLIALYVAKTLAQAEQVRAADENRDDAALGALLGYPTCCVEHVVQSKVPPIRDTTVIFADADGLFDPLLWPPAMAVDRALLSHFPCGRACSVSRAIARVRLQSLRDWAPGIHAELINSLSWWYSQSPEGQIQKHDFHKHSDKFRYFCSANHKRFRIFRPICVGAIEWAQM